MGYYINPPKPRSKTTWVKSFQPRPSKGYCSCLESFNYLVIPHSWYPKMPYILIQVNEGNPKLHTLMVEGYGRT